MLSIRFLIVQPTTMELTKNSLDFITNHFGYTPVKTVIHHPDETSSVAYLMPSRHGMEPWPVPRIEAYVSYMRGTK